MDRQVPAAPGLVERSGEGGCGGCTGRAGQPTSSDLDRNAALHEWPAGDRRGGRRRETFQC